MPFWKSPLHVWLKSEYLHNVNYRRFGTRPVVFEQPSWPIGLRTRSDKGGDITAEAAFEIIDTGFDYDSSCAWQLPLRYSRLKLGERGGLSTRDSLNWLIRSIGRWQKGEDRFQQIASVFNDNDRLAWKGHRLIRTGYALTPFCIITQRWAEDDDNSVPVALFSDIALFYTFETFIQECLALDACRKGVDPAAIAESYEHIYFNSRPHPEFIFDDPGKFAMSLIAETRIDWRRILDLQYHHDAALIQATRLNLFRARRQCHLMAAIAAACIGIPEFAAATTVSTAVKTAESPFTPDALAHHWLRHVTGGPNYPSECEHLLTVLAARYGNSVSINYRGVPEPPPWIATTDVEVRVGSQIPPLLLSRGEPEGYGRYRWALFDTSLDDQSIRDWQETVGNLR